MFGQGHRDSLLLREPAHWRKRAKRIARFIAYYQRRAGRAELRFHAIWNGDVRHNMALTTSRMGKYFNLFYRAAAHREKA